MRIAWFTPLSERSAIAEFSLHVGAALAAHAEVELWIPGTLDARTTELPTVDFVADPVSLERLPRYDLTVYNLGNHAGYHAAIYEASKRHPGTVVLHDRVLHHFFFSHWYFSGRRDLYVERMEALHGDEGRRIAEDSLAGLRRPAWEDDEAVRRFPFIEEALGGARAAVVHAADQAEEVSGRWYGPVGALFVPGYAPAQMEEESLPAPLRPDGRLTLLTMGHVNRNKQIDRVIEAIADAGLHDRVRYIVIGPADSNGGYGIELERLIQTRGLEGTVQLAGYQPDNVLGKLVREADILVNLRYPSFEGGSASLMQGLALGKPTLVYDAASFAELPDGAVVKIPPSDASALVRALERLVTSEGLRRTTAEGALAAAEERSPERYAREFLAFADTAREWEPALKLCDRVSEELSELAVSPRLEAVGRIARQTSLILAPDPPQPVDAAEYREIVRSDEPALARFLIRNDVPEVTGHFDPFPMTEETAHTIVGESRRDRFYGAFLGDRMLAFSMLRGWDEGYDVPSFGIAVDADFHGRQIGSRMTSWTLEQARLVGSDRVRLSVYGGNAPARRIYERLGFHEVERNAVRRNGRPDERIVMVKQLG